jgi:hypothetical protein
MSVPRDDPAPLPDRSAVAAVVALRCLNLLDDARVGSGILDRRVRERRGLQRSACQGATDRRRNSQHRMRSRHGVSSSRFQDTQAMRILVLWPRVQGHPFSGVAAGGAGAAGRSHASDRRPGYRERKRSGRQAAWAVFRKALATGRRRQSANRAGGLLRATSSSFSPHTTELLRISPDLLVRNGAAATRVMQKSARALHGSAA